jgi:hypothetical protein
MFLAWHLNAAGDAFTVWRRRETITPVACSALKEGMSIERIIDVDQIGQQRTGRLMPVAATFVPRAR